MSHCQDILTIDENNNARGLSNIVPILECDKIISTCEKMALHVANQTVISQLFFNIVP